MLRFVAKANAILVVQYAVGSLVPLVLIPHIVRTIGISMFGQLAVAMAWGGYGSVVVHYGFQLTGPARLTQLSQVDSPSEVFWDILLAKMVLLLGVLPIMALALFFTPNATSTFALCLPLFGLPLAAGLNSAWFLQARGRFAWVCLSAIAGSIATLWIGFSFVNSSEASSVLAASSATIVGPILSGFITLVFAWKSISLQRVSVRLNQVLLAIRDGSPLFASQFVSALYMLSGPILVNQVVDAHAAGTYSALLRLINAFSQVCLLTHVAAYPSLANAYNNDREAYWQLLRWVLAIYLSVTATLSIIAWVFRDWLYSFLFGQECTEESALLAWGLIWLVFGIFGTALTGYLTVSGRSRAVLSLTLRLLALALALGVPGLVLFGGTGWMAALVLSQTLVLYTGYRLWSEDHAGSAVRNIPRTSY